MGNLELLLLILAIFGGIDLAGRGARLLYSIFPYLLTYRRIVISYIDSVVKTPALKKLAISSRIDEVLNQNVFYLSQYLPVGWVRRAEISWVSGPRAAHLENGAILLRIKPTNNQDDNLMEAIWSYFRAALFPETRDIIPHEYVSSIALAMTRAALQARHPYLLERFDSQFIPALASGEQGQMNAFADCTRLNDFGLLMGPFVRELDIAAKAARFSSGRVSLPEIISSIIQHMLGFQPIIRSNKPDGDWSHNSGFSSYRFILVSRPPNLRSGIEAYVHRAKKGLADGIQRFYLIGRQEERDFFHKVASATLELRALRGYDLFPLYKDYRGVPGGYGAVLGVDEILARLPFEDRQNSLAEPIEMPDEANGSIPDGAPGESDPLSDLSLIVDGVIRRSRLEDKGWAHLAYVGQELKRLIPGFDPQYYGAKNLASLLKNIADLEFDERGEGSAKTVLVRKRQHFQDVSRALETGAAFANESIAEVKKDIVELLRDHSDNNGWMFLGQVGAKLKIKRPNLIYKGLGFSSLFDLIAQIPEVERVERDGMRNKTYVRLIRRSAY